MEVLHRRPAVIRRVPAPPSRVVEQPLPPRVPENLDELEELVTLLGAYVQVDGKLRSTRLERVKTLAGTLPKIEEAKAWKSSLKELRNELALLEARQAERL